MIRNIVFAFLSMLCIVLICSGCAESEARTIPSTNHVIILGFDGWAGSSFENASMPFVKSLLSESAWTIHKRSILPSSSACNWASMFMGTDPEAHGYVAWDTSSPVFPQTDTNENGFFPNIFSLYRSVSKDYEFGYFYQWGGMKYIVDAKDFDTMQQFPVSKSGTIQMTATAKKYIMNKKPALAAFIWDYPDAVGHTTGWDSSEYLDELTNIDTIISDIVTACKEAGIYDNTLFVITSDHGGHDKTHGTYDFRDLESPLILFGKGVKKGVEIKTPVMQYDVAAILCNYLHLVPPASWRGKSVDGIFN